MQTRTTFNPQQLSIITHAAGMAEELVSNHFKMAASQWLRPMYDVKTLAELDPAEIVDGPFPRNYPLQGAAQTGEFGLGHL